jgi:hypothetical protein
MTTTVRALHTCPEETRRDWARYQHWATLCEAGRCAYTTLAGNEADPPWRAIDAPEVCPGTAGTLHLEAQRYVIRARNCARKDAWWARRQIVLRAQRHQHRGHGSTATKAWREET